MHGPIFPFQISFFYLSLSFHNTRFSVLNPLKKLRFVHLRDFSSKFFTKFLSIQPLFQVQVLVRCRNTGRDLSYSNWTRKRTKANKCHSSQPTILRTNIWLRMARSRAAGRSVCVNNGFPRLISRSPLWARFTLTPALHSSPPSTLSVVLLFFSIDRSYNANTPPIFVQINDGRLEIKSRNNPAGLFIIRASSRLIQPVPRIGLNFEASKPANLIRPDLKFT